MDLHSYDGWLEYTPEFEGNREETEPFTLEIKVMNAADWKRFKIADGQRMVGENHVAEIERIVTRELLSRTRNFRHLNRVVHTSDGVTKTPIETPEKFNEHAADPLRLEVYKAITSTADMSEGLKKK